MKSLFPFLSVFTTGIIAGLFFSWSVSVMPGLRKVHDDIFVHSMQSMNRAIQNPIFFTFFFGALIFAVLFAFQEYKQPVTASWYFLLMSVAVYALGVLGITIVGNVPLNIQLDHVDTTAATFRELQVGRDNFENLWTKLNVARTIFSCIAFGLQIIYLYVKGQTS